MHGRDERKLKNGSFESQEFIDLVVNCIDELAHIDPFALLDLLQVCKDLTYEIDKLPKSSKDILNRMGLMTKEGKVHKRIRNIVLSSLTIVDSSYDSPHIKFDLPYSPP